MREPIKKHSGVRERKPIIAYKVLAVEQNLYPFSPFTGMQWFANRCKGKLADGGIYAFKSRDAAVIFSRDEARGLPVFKVALWGTVLEHADEPRPGNQAAGHDLVHAGYRATRAKNLGLSDPRAQFLSERSP